MKKITLICAAILFAAIAINNQITSGLMGWLNTPSTTKAEIAGKDGALTVTAANTIVNKYAVLAGDAAAGSSKITVANPGGTSGLDPATLTAGDLIMIIQMAGATIDLSDTSNYGLVTSLNNAGRHEYVTVNAVNGNMITINPPCGGLRFNYTASGKVQVIRVPQYTTLTINVGASLTAPAWNGQIGGIVAVHVQNNAVINGTVDVSELGFRGGGMSAAGGAGFRTDYRTDQQDFGAEKGEGIAGYQIELDMKGGRYARGAAANGGGGGTSHNSGGGGGANGANGKTYTGQGVMDGSVTGAAAWQLDPSFLANGNALTDSAGGGRGGYSYAINNGNALTQGPGNAVWGADNRREVGGLGGHPVPQDTTGRIFIGGGGGAGAQNNDAGGAGGVGGGLIYIIANNVSGNGLLRANGANGGNTRNTHRDGAGGAGGGGTIVLAATTLANGLSAQANGGNGGNQSQPLPPALETESEGPGGGGGGGFIAYSGGTLSTQINGGANGSTQASAISEFPTNGATRGAGGAVSSVIANIPFCSTTTDLSITKTNNTTTIIPGAPTTYTIVVKNNGPNDVFGVPVTDNLPAIFGNASWTCVATTGSSCFSASGTGNLNTKVDLLKNGMATFLLTGTPDPSATGQVTNTATVGMPDGAVDPNPGNDSATDIDTQTPQADLSVTKTNGVNVVTAGTSTTYTIVVRNNGPSTVNGATVSDPIPAKLANATWTCAASAGGSCGAASGNGNINTTVSLPPNATATFTVTAMVVASATGTLANTVTVTSPASVSDTNAGNNSATDTDNINTTVDLSITKTDGVTSVTPGTQTTYNIVVSNAGPSAVVGALVTDTLPSNLTSATWTCTASAGSSCGAASGSGNISTTVDLLNGGSATFSLKATVVSAATGTVTNTASVAVPQGTTDSSPGNNSATDTDQLTPTVDLAITKTNGTTTVVAGTQTTYTVVVTNNGPSAVTGAAVSDAIPAKLSGATWTCAASAGSSCGAASGSGNVNTTVTLLLSGTATFTITATVLASASGQLVNAATVAAPGGVTESNAGNNSATDTDTINSVADLRISKTNNTTTAIPGNQTTYNIVVTNDGPSAVAGTTVVDPLPSALSNASWTCTASNGSACAASAGTGGINTTVDLAIGGSATFALTATVSSSATGSLTNTATVGAPAGTTDPNTGNNSATDTDPLTPTADLSVTKTANSGTVTAGSQITYTIVATNNGPSVANGATVTDTLPSSLANATWTCTATAGSSCSAPNGSGNINTTVNLLVNGKATFTLTATVSPTASGSIVNSVGLAPPPGTNDPTPDNGTTTTTTTVTTSSDLRVTKSASQASIRAGDELTYTITVSNLGPSTAADVTLTDALQTGVVFISATPSQGTCAGTETVTCNLGTISPLAPNNTATVALKVRVPFTFPTGQLTNTAVVGSPTSDPVSNNNTGTSTVTVNAPPGAGFKLVDFSVRNTATDACIGAGNVINVEVKLKNSGDGVQRDNPGAEFSALLPVQLSAIPGTCTASNGACTLNSSQVDWNGEIQPGQTLTITYQVRVRQGTQVGTRFCTDFKVNFDSNSDGVNDALLTVNNCLEANCTPPPCTGPDCPGVGPGLPFPDDVNSVSGDTRPGSILIFPLYISDALSNNVQNTRINITNIEPSRTVYLHMFFVDGSNCSVADNFLCLTPNQTTSFLISDLDPGVSGYLIAIAVDSQGCPVKFNYLIGDAYIKLSSGHSANLGAEAVAAIGNPVCSPTSNVTTINLNGVEYSRLGRILVADNIPSVADGNSTLLILDRIGGDLSSNASTLGALFGLIYNDVEASFSFGVTQGTCQLRTALSGSFPRSAPRFPDIVPAGRSGWIKLGLSTEGGMVGATINFNANSGSFRGGHNLHKLTLGNTSLTFPVLSPSCQ